MLEPNDKKVMFTKALIAEFSMPIFAVDLLKDAYKTEDPFELQKLLEEILNINLGIQTIIEYVGKDLTPSPNVLRFVDL